MKRAVKKITIISICAFIAVLLLIDTQFIAEQPQIKTPPPKEISIDVMIEKQQFKPKPPKPKVEPEPETTKDSVASTKKCDDEVLNGALPPINANYREHLGFNRYAMAMHARGARFYILGEYRGQIYNIIFANQTVIKVSPGDIMLANFSARTRIIDDEPALKPYLAKAKKQFGINKGKVILLVPQTMEDKIASELASSGYNSNEYKAFKGHYQINSGKFILMLKQAVRFKGTQNMDLRICL